MMTSFPYTRNQERRNRIHAGITLSTLGFVAGFLVLAGLPARAVAGGHATVSIGSSQSQASMDIEWRDTSTARFTVNVPGARGISSYSLLRNGKLYVVSNGQVAPASMVKMIGGMFEGNKGGVNAMPRDATRPTLSGPIGNETIAGIRGSVYRVHWANGSRHQGQINEIVLTDNSLVRQMTKVWIAYITAIGDKRSSRMMQDFYGNRGMLGISRTGNDLRVGRGDFRVVRIDGRMPPASDFVLPARVSPGMSMPGRSSLPSMGQEQVQKQRARQGNNSGSSHSGFFGKIREQFNQAEQRQGNNVDNRVNRKADNIVNNVLDHLFGN